MDKIKILLADDVKIMRSLLVSEVDNGDDVISKVSELKPDMVFLDISMPGKNGLDVLKEIKEKFSNVFVAMISGHNTFENIKRSMELGADGFVVKPYTTIKIQEMIHKYQAG